MKTEKKIKKVRLAIIILFIIAVAAAGFFLLTGMGKAKAQAYTETKVSLATDSKVIEASGNIESIRQSDLSFATIGLISAVYVSQGQKVKDGEALAALDDSEQRYNYLNAQQKLEQNVLTGNIRQTALAELELAMRKTELNRAKLTAPFAGFISSLNVEAGEYVGNGKVAMTLVDRSTLVATLQIDEVDIPLVKLGQRVEFTFDALEGRTLNGVVSQIPPVGKITNQGLAVFDVEAKIDAPPDDLLPGFSFSAQIIVREPKTYLSIPSEALVELPPRPDSTSEGQPQPGNGVSPGAEPGVELGAVPSAESQAAPVSPEQSGNPAAATVKKALTGRRERNATGTGQGTGRLQANLSPEQIQALLARRQANLAAGSGTMPGEAGKNLLSRPMPMACLVPGLDGKPEIRKFLGLKRSDGTVAVIQGLAEGDIILIPVVEKKTVATKSASTGFRIPGLGGPPQGGSGGGQQEGTRR